MFQTLRNAWKIEDLRKKLLFTLLILVIVRLGCAIPVPFLDPSRLQEMLDSTQGNLLGYLNLLTGGAFAEATLFALGVSPYITASIVIQLLTVAIPSLERMAKGAKCCMRSSSRSWMRWRPSAVKRSASRNTTR